MPQFTLYIRMSGWTAAGFFRTALPFLLSKAVRKGESPLYLALYRKYRPTTFADVVSQPHVTRTLQNEVAQGKTAHAYLFTGSRGTGKTTCAKILAMAVNCEHPIDGDPCHECESCKAIAEGTTLDVMEIDAASNNGVDNIRQLREEANYTPAQCRYRVYIIDEVHMLSDGAFNALLKIMEEPPPHVKFILATTEVHKIPVTILSRCQRFDFHRIRTEDIAKRLLYIADNEPFALTEDAASLIARLSDGGMRDAISLLDQCASFSNDITAKTVVDAAGVAGRDDLFALTDCVIRADAAGAIEQIGALYEKAKDLSVLLSELCVHFRNLMLVHTMKDVSSVLTVSPEEEARIREQASSLPLSSVLSSLSQMRETLDQMGRTADRRLLLELCFVRLCTPSLNKDETAMLSRLDRLEATVRALRETGIPAQTNQPVQTADTLTEIPAGKPERTPMQTDDSLKNAPQQPTPSPAILPETPEAPSEQAESEPVQTDLPPKAPARAPAGEILPFAQWDEVLLLLAKTGGPLYGILQSARAFTDGVTIYIDSSSAFAASMFKQEGNAAKFLDAAEQITGVRYKLRVKGAKAKKTQTDPLLDVLKKAQDAGVEIHKEM